MKIQLREYQEEAIAALRNNIRRGVKWQILSSPTGSGKTEIAMSMIQSAIRRGKTVEFIADRQALVNQASQRFSGAGITHGVLMGNDTRDTDEKVRVCSAQTVESRGLDIADLYIIDEAHEIRRGLLDKIKEVGDTTFVIGLTATAFPPMLAAYYTEIVNVTTTNQLIVDKFLSPLKIVAPPVKVDTKGLDPGRNGEWDQDAIGERSLRIVGEVVSEWECQITEHFNNEVQPTIVFAASVAAAQVLEEKFSDKGYDFRVVSYLTPGENQRIIDEFRAGKCVGLVNCSVLSRGFDAPDTRIIVDAYPLHSSLVTHIQRLGRVMRIAPGKNFGLVIDHAENWERFKIRTHDFYQNGPPPLCLPNKRKDNGKQKAQELSKGGSPASYEVVDGKLILIDEVTGAANRFEGDLWEELCANALTVCGGDVERSKKRALAAYKSITGVWPKRGFVSTERQADAKITKLANQKFIEWRSANGVRNG